MSASAAAPPSTVDTLAPGVTIGPHVSVLKIGDVAHLTFTLSEAATNFVLTDIAVTGGTLSNFAGKRRRQLHRRLHSDPRSTTAADGQCGGYFTDAADNGNTPGPAVYHASGHRQRGGSRSISGDLSPKAARPGLGRCTCGTLRRVETATIDLAVADIDSHRRRAS